MSDMVLSADVELACRRLVMSFAHHVDHRRFREVADLFADDGVWLRRGETMRGPDQILAFLEKRAATVVERHVMSTTLVEQLTHTTCSATSYVTIFRANRVGDAIPDLTAPAAFGEFHDMFRLTDDGWRFAYRTSEPVFTCGAG
jgi:SnoaL-like domain